MDPNIIQALLIVEAIASTNLDSETISLDTIEPEEKK